VGGREEDKCHLLSFICGIYFKKGMKVVGRLLGNKKRITGKGMSVGNGEVNMVKVP
jgi:hypothetical protein